ncbi:MAG: DinB family protein [Candidatus Heimdallarchaeota archaeon]
MVYSLKDTVDILSRTPSILRKLLENLDVQWLNFRKHDAAFSPKDVIGHLILGEKYDWIPRMRLMLDNDPPKKFPPFERTGFDTSLGLEESLSQFETLRAANLDILEKEVEINDLLRTGIHPELGEVTLKQHLATWVVHDYTHLFQIIETLSLRYKHVVGPWIEYLRILQL